MAHLSELMSGPQRTAVVSDCGELVEGVVAKQSGITGMALKGAVAAAKKVDAAIIAKALDRVLPDVLDALDPHWQDFASNPEQDFGSFLEPRSAEVSDSIMSVADKHAEQINSPALSKPYNSLRGKASKLLTPAVPDFGRVLQKHM
mgnify:FL=1